MPESTQRWPDGHPNRWPILFALCGALLVMSVGEMSVTIALPSVARDLGATNTELQWITGSTVLALSSLLIAMGALADRYGRRQVLLTGLAVFGLASSLAALCRTPGQLIAARGLVGIGNAMIMPATLSTIRAVFSGRELPRALAVWAAVASVGVVLGPIGAGVLVERFGWRGVFVAWLPILLAATVAIVRVVPPFPGITGTSPDVPGVLLISGGSVAAVDAIIEAPHRDVGQTLGTVGLAAALIAVFVFRQRRATHPLIDLGLVTRRFCWPAALAAATGFFSLMGVLFLVTQYFQDVRGHRPATAALLLLPIAAGQLVMAPCTPRLIARHGPRVVASGGLLFLAAGLAMIPVSLSSGQVWLLLAGLTVLASGNAAAVTAASAAIMGGAFPHRAGFAAAVNETAFKLGGSLGVAVLGSVLAARLDGALSVRTAALPPEQRGRAAESIAGALLTARRVGGPDGDRLAAAARDAFTTGFGRAALVAAALALAVAAITAVTLQTTDRPDHD